MNRNLRKSKGSSPAIRQLEKNAPARLQNEKPAAGSEWEEWHGEAPSEYAASKTHESRTSGRDGSGKHLAKRGNKSLNNNQSSKTEADWDDPGVSQQPASTRQDMVSDPGEWIPDGNELSTRKERAEFGRRGPYRNNEQDQRAVQQASAANSMCNGRTKSRSTKAESEPARRSTQRGKAVAARAKEGKKS
jgi:hypothetical protein